MKWTPSNTAKATYLGVIEVETSNGEMEVFEVLQDDDRLIFGGASNTGFLESGFIRREPGETTDDTLGEMVSDLETHYQDGAQYCARIVCNERI